MITLTINDTENNKTITTQFPSMEVLVDSKDLWLQEIITAYKEMLEKEGTNK